MQQTPLVVAEAAVAGAAVERHAALAAEGLEAGAPLVAAFATPPHVAPS